MENSVFVVRKWLFNYCRNFSASADFALDLLPPHSSSATRP